MTCTCGQIHVGMTVTDQRNWNPDCDEHGTMSEWWQSKETQDQIAERAERSRVAQARARAARLCNDHSGVDCPNCQQGDF